MHKSHWQLDYERNKDFLSRHHTEDVFRDWELVGRPDTAVEQELSLGLKLLYVGQRDLAKLYLERATALAERALRENKCQSGRARDDYPVNEGFVLRALAYARALLGETVDPTLFDKAARLVARHCAEIPKGDWDVVIQSLHLAAVRLALLAGAREGALTILKSKKLKVSKGNLEEETLLGRLALTTELEGREALEGSFRAFFDRVRDPAYRHPDSHEPVLHRFELGALYGKYFVSGNGEIDWGRVIETVSE